MYDLPVVETTGYITLSLRDREKVNVRITEINIMKIPVRFQTVLVSFPATDSSGNDASMRSRHRHLRFSKTEADDLSLFADMSAGVEPC